MAFASNKSKEQLAWEAQSKKHLLLKKSASFIKKFTAKRGLPPEVKAAALGIEAQINTMAEDFEPGPAPVMTIPTA
jgi:hypothetical protein